MKSIDALCLHCGLCCDSTLFADVELRAGDEAKRLPRVGLTLHQKTRTKLAFSQPCACFDGKLCRIYAERPKRCGLFACGLLNRVESREMTVNAALKKIASAKNRAEQVRDRLRSLGQRDERMALTHRYAGVMASPMDFSQPGETEQRGELMLALNDLMTQLQRDFLR